MCENYQRFLEVYAALWLDQILEFAKAYKVNLETKKEIVSFLEHEKLMCQKHVSEMENKKFKIRFLNWCLKHI